MLRIRLIRGGAKKQAFYRIVVADQRAPRDGRFVERLGHYNPRLAHGHADRVVLRSERIRYWLSVGAQPSDRVARLLGSAEIIPMPVRRETPKKSAPKAKARERAAEANVAGSGSGDGQTVSPEA